MTACTAYMTWTLSSALVQRCRKIYLLVGAHCSIIGKSHRHKHTETEEVWQYSPPQKYFLHEVFGDHFWGYFWAQMHTLLPVVSVCSIFNNWLATLHWSQILCNLAYTAGRGVEGVPLQKSSILWYLCIILLAGSDPVHADMKTDLVPVFADSP